MGVFVFILLLLIISIILVIIGSTLQFSILVCTKKSVPFELTILPSIISLAALICITTITTYILSIFDINILLMLYQGFLKMDFNFSNLIYALFSYLGAFILFVFIQAFCLELIYLDYKKIFRNVFKKKVQIEGYVSPCEGKWLCEIRPKISYLNGFLIGLLSSSILIFLIVFFSFLGVSLSGKIIK